MTAKTPVYEIEYLVEGEPVRNTRLALENNAKSIEAALLAGGIAPPLAPDLAAVAGRVSILEAKAAGQSHNVTDAAYGAAGNGVTNDRNAIQAALDAAYADGGGVVLIPPGVYRVNSGLIVRANVVISAYGATILRGTPTFALLRNFDKAVDSFPLYSGNSNIMVLGGTWDGNASAATATSGNVFSFAHCENITVRDVTILDVADAHAIEFNGARHSRVVNCRAFGYKSIGGTNSEAFQFDLSSTSTGLCAPYDNTPCQNILIDGNHVGKSTKLNGWPRMVGSHYSASGVWQSAFRVVNNIAYDCTDHAIRAYQWVDVVVANNTVVGGNIGIQIRSGDLPASNNVDRCVVVGNTVRNTTGDGIQFTGISGGGIARELVVGNNMIAAPGGNGIGMTYAYGAVISGNQIVSSASTGISVSFSDNVAVTGNRVRSSASHGIAAGDSKMVNVVGNTVRTTVGYGIVLSPNALDGAVRSNHVASATAGAYRASVGSNFCAFVGNTARLDGVTNAAGMALVITSACTGVQHYGNDFYGFGAAGIGDTGVSSVTAATNRV